MACVAYTRALKDPTNRQPRSKNSTSRRQSLTGGNFTTQPNIFDMVFDACPTLGPIDSIHFADIARSWTRWLPQTRRKNRHRYVISRSNRVHRDNRDNLAKQPRDKVIREEKKNRVEKELHWPAVKLGQCARAWKMKFLLQILGRIWMVSLAQVNAGAFTFHEGKFNNWSTVVY